MPTASKPYTLIEGRAVVVNMTAVANPSPINYLWFKEDQDGKLREIKSTGSRLTFENGVLNISSVEREDAGYYTISATNDEGTTQTKIRLDVHYPPR